MKVFLVAAVLLGAGAVAWKYLPQSTEAAGVGVGDESTYVVERDTLEITVTENGYLKAKNSVNIKPEFSRSGTITWLVDEGTEVAEGDKLAEFDATDLQTEIDETSNRLLQYETELAAARAEVEIQVRDNAASIEAAKFALELANLKRERYIEGDGPNELRKLDLAAEKAESAFERAKFKFAQVPDLVKEGFLTKDQEEEERIRVRELEINKQNADEDLRLYKKYTDPMQRTELENTIKDSDRQLINATEKAEINLAEVRARVTREERQFNSTKARLTKLEDEFAKMTIHAPSPGIVHYGDPARPWNRENVKVGNSFHKGNTLITLPDLREMQVLVSVHEADIELIDEEMVVVVTVEAAKGKLFPAKVTHIASVAESDWADEANKTFRVEITMDPIDMELRAGITAKAEIQVEEIPDTLLIPIHTVFSEQGTQFVFVTNADGGFERREVEVGKNNAHYVQVLAGLDEGGHVFLYDPREAGQVETKSLGADEETESLIAPAVTASRSEE